MAARRRTAKTDDEAVKPAAQDAPEAKAPVAGRRSITPEDAKALGLDPAPYGKAE